jgi:hypothetical protein
MFKYLSIALIAVNFMALPVQAQSNSDAKANALSASQSGSQANNQIAFNTPSNTKADINNVPSVSAPSLGGGGHPCLAAISGGVSVLGGGVSLGKSGAEVVCMLAFMGQNEAAIRALVAKSPAACEAINAVGYYVVPMGNGATKAVAFECAKKTIIGGVYSKQVASATVSSKSRPATTVPWAKCEMRGGSIFIKHKYFDTARKDAAVRSCQAHLGY